MQYTYHRIKFKKIFLSVILFLLLKIFFLPSFVFAASIVINEFSSATTSDWIELYNDSNSEVDLQGWIIKDTATSPVYEFTNTLIPAYGFCVKTVSNRLNNNGDKIQLFQGDEQRNCVAYGDGNGSFCKEVADIDASIGGLVAARKPDGTGSWTFGSPTSGYSNNATQEPENKILCYTPSPTPTPTLTPTSTPTFTPTPTLKPTNTPTIKPTATPTSSKPSITSTNSSTPLAMLIGGSNKSELITTNSGSVLEGTVAAATTTSGEALEATSTTRSWPFGKILLLLAGLTFLVGAGSLIFVYNRQQNENKENNQ